MWIKVTWNYDRLPVFLRFWLFCFVIYRQRRGFQLLQENQRVSPKTKTGNIKSARTETRRRTKSIRSTNTVAKIEVKIKTRKRRRIKAGIMILVPITQRSTMKRLGNILLCSLVTLHLHFWILETMKLFHLFSTIMISEGRTELLCFFICTRKIQCLLKFT